MTAYSLSFLFLLHSSNLLWNAISGNKALIFLCPLIVYNPDLNLRLVKWLLSYVPLKLICKFARRFSKKLLFVIFYLYIFLVTFYTIIFPYLLNLLPWICLSPWGKVLSIPVLYFLWRTRRVNIIWNLFWDTWSSQ